MRYLAALAVMLLVATAAVAQFHSNTAGPGSSATIGPATSFAGGGSGGGGGACGAGQLDFSNSCNTVLYMVILR